MSNPHCGSEVDRFGTHGLSCKFSQGGMSRHHSINNIIYHSLSAAKVKFLPDLIPLGFLEQMVNVQMVYPWSHGHEGSI